MKVVMMMCALAGCATVPRTAAGRLGHEQTMAEVKLTPRDAAREVTRLFSTRGYPLVAQQASEQGMSLRFKGHRDPTWTTSSYTGYGSMFAVSMSSSGTNTLVAIDGTPMLNDEPMCELGATLPCTGFAPDRDMNGAAEAEVVQGVLAELELQDLVVPLDASHPAVQAAREADRARCKAQAELAVREAQLIADPKRRLKVVEGIEPCR